MKKKLLSILLVGLIVLTGCSGEKGSSDDHFYWKPEQVSSDVIPYAEQAIKIIDAYLAFEIDADEATKAFEELVDRLETLEVTGVDSKYSWATQNLAYKIRDLKYPSADSRTDLEYHQIRDVIAYQIGEEVSGKIYTVKDSGNVFQDESAPEALKTYSAPASRTFSRFSGESYYVSITFDYMNGLAPVDIIEHTKTLTSILSESAEADNAAFNISVAYECYEQNVLYLFLNIDSTRITGSVIRNDEESHGEIDSAEDIALAVKSAAEYFNGP